MNSLFIEHSMGSKETHHFILIIHRDSRCCKKEIKKMQMLILQQRDAHVVPPLQQ